MQSELGCAHPSSRRRGGGCWLGGASTAPQEGLVCDTAAVGTLAWSQYTCKNLEARRGYASQPGAIGEGRG